GGIYAVFLGILLTAAHQRISRSLIFEVTSAALMITHISPGGRRSTRRLRHGAIDGVEVNRENENLTIRVRGRDDVMMFVGDRRTSAAAANALNQALRESPPIEDGEGEPLPPPIDI